MNINRLLHTLTLCMVGLGLQAQNVGIGEPNPTAKLHITQPDNANAVLVVQTGTGNAIEVISNVAGNAASLAFLRNGTSGITLEALIGNTASTASNIISTNNGLGFGVEVQQLNTGANSAGVFVNQSGNGVLSRGVEIVMQSTTNTDGQAIFNDGLGRGSFIDIRNTSNNVIGSYLLHQGLGVGTQTELTNAANTSTVNFLRTVGLGRGLEVSLTNANNRANGISVFHSGSGVGQFINMSNTNADLSSSGLLVQYNGTGTANFVDGGGNAAEFQHNGTNGNAVDIFVGDPTAASGPANTTNEFAALSISHMAEGFSSTLNATKSAINAINYSSDPTIIATNRSPTSGPVIEAYRETTSPSSFFDIAVYGRADAFPATGNGVGVWGVGGFYGVIGETSAGDTTGGANYGVFSFGDMGATGVKTFAIDHPFAPTQKTLRHFSVESNEVLNMYRGIIELDANGQGVVTLPDYFDAINTNVTYQLTPIGIGVQPYIAEEEANNQFTVAGAPNTKVSWTVHAERDDPVLRYFESLRGPDYKSDVINKRTAEQGKYLVPGAYGQPKEAGVLYNAAREQRIQEGLNQKSRQSAMKASKSHPSK